jgi:Fe-S-cluster-containing hydrogenase component 2/CRP-like cAMP-binding protein
MQRLMGLTSVIWNLPRSVTLIAGGNAGIPCELLLIKRKVLIDIIEATGDLHERVAKLLGASGKLPDDWYTRETPFSVADFEETVWPTYLNHLKTLAEKKERRPPAEQWVHDHWESGFKDWLLKLSLSELDHPAKERILAESNRIAGLKDLYQVKMKDFLEHTLPRHLAGNRLFRDSFYLNSVRENGWATLADLLLGRAGEDERSEPARARIRKFLSEGFQEWLAQCPAGELEDLAKYRIIKELNYVLEVRDLYSAEAWPDTVNGEAAPLLERGMQSLEENEIRRLNRLLIEAAFSGLIQAPPGDKPSLEDLRRFVTLARELMGQLLLPQDCEKGDELIYDQEQPADALYLILGGKFRISRKMPGGETMLINHLERNGYFGESCFEEGARHRSRVEAITRGQLLKIPREVVVRLAKEYPAFGEKLRREAERMRHRDTQLEAGYRLPPPDLPPQTASKLMRATNLLLIDMGLCTRCDQCVRACGEAHEDRPRFHRANPELRFGKWEVAGACVHCVDAPCQHACPVGAITFLNTGAVQIHRDRCIGCKQCAEACPFYVIDMYPPAVPEDAPSLSLPKMPNVATKCDLCLTQDRAPPCVAACPYGAAQRGSPIELVPGIKGYAEFRT